MTVIAIISEICALIWYVYLYHCHSSTWFKFHLELEVENFIRHFYMMKMCPIISRETPLASKLDWAMTFLVCPVPGIVWAIFLLPGGWSLNWWSDFVTQNYRQWNLRWWLMIQSLQDLGLSLSLLFLFFSEHKTSWRFVFFYYYYFIFIFWSKLILSKYMYNPMPIQCLC